MKKILVATDGSENSERALIEAKIHAQCTGGEITIVTVVESTRRIAGYGPMPSDDRYKEGSNIALEKALQIMGDFKGKIDTKIKRGNPADEIVKVAEEGAYDLIIMGNRGQNAFSRTFLGSVSIKVLNRTKTDIMIIK